MSNSKQEQDLIDLQELINSRGWELILKSLEARIRELEQTILDPISPSEEEWRAERLLQDARIELFCIKSLAGFPSRKINELGAVKDDKGFDPYD